MRKSGFSFKRLLGMIIKEFHQMRRDPVTVGMLIVIPLIQLIIFGYAINNNPRNLETVIVNGDHSAFTRTLISSIQNTQYFRIKNANVSEKQATDLLESGQTQFVINIPTDFTQKLLSGQKPNILVTADASDPTTTGNAIGALRELTETALNLNLDRGFRFLKQSDPPFQLLVHAKYNPESITQYSIIPGLMGVILTMTLVMITGLAITKEYEIGTIENLLVTPVRPLEVMLGKSNVVSGEKNTDPLYQPEVF